MVHGIDIDTLEGEVVKDTEEPSKDKGKQPATKSLAPPFT